MKEQFRLKGVNITDIFYSPYHIKGSVKKYAIEHEDRKPRPGMFLKAVKKHNIDLSRSIMVGDKPSDRIKLDSLKSVILKSEYTKNDSEGYDVETLLDVIDYLIP
jgi:D-glycero-D-manno-heptose 1,7-bisphosphate phosphatase